MALDHVPADVWRWAGELMAHGAAQGDVVASLVSAGVASADAEALVRVVTLLAPLSMASQLRREVGPEGVREVARGELWDKERFFRDHWELGRPLVLRGYADHWPARRWTFQGLAERFPEAAIEVEVDRSAARHFEGRWVDERLVDFLADLETRPGNDRYCIARNHNLDKALAPLLDDVEVDPEWFEARRMRGGASLWIGPRGTFTPLHYDTTHILFTQLIGRKRFGLVSPDWCGLALRLDGFYVKDDLAAVPPHALVEVTLEPGDALFLPVGWYHRVEALDPSLSLSLLCFRRHNDFTWAHPQRLGRGARGVP